MWIAIEGIDGAGKSSVILNVQEKLLAKKIKVVLTKEPGGTELGQKLRSIIELNYDFKTAKDVTADLSEYPPIHIS